MAVPFATGNNFMLTKEGYRLPDTRKDTSIFLISDSFEYDIETIKKLPPPKIDYSNIIIPFKIDSKIGTNVFNFNKPDNVYAKQEEMIKNSKLVPPLNVISYPYPNILNMNLYISYSEVISRFNAFYRQMPLAYIKENICTILEQLFRPFNFSKTKVILVDTKRYQIYNNPSEGLMKNDIINGILSAYYLLPPNRLRRLNVILWFKSDNGDFKVDLNNIDRRDNDRFLKMLETLGIPFEGEENPVDTPKELEDDGEIDEKIEKEIEDRLDNVNVDIDKEEEDNPETVSSDISNILSSINSIKSRFDITSAPKEDQTEKLRHAKELEIQAELLKRVSTPMGVQGNYRNIASDMTSPSDNSVEDKMITNASKKISNVVVAANTADANNNVSTDRERKMRDRIGRLKLGNITFDTLTSVTDVPKPPVIKPIKLSTTNPGVLKGTSFTNISKAYEENLMDRDIVQTFMNLSKLPEGYEITNIEVTDISSVVSLKNDWKVSLRSKLTGRQNLIHIHVPKVINGKFYDNGVWYNIGKQDFPVPVLKLKPTRVMLTSNYQKITVERYDTKSLVDVGILIKVLTKVMQENGNNKYVKPGSSVVANSKFMSTIEYDEYAKRWYSFINKEAQLEIYFNRIQCAKLYDFVVVKDDEFCCGMINKVPIVINVETGLARNGKTLTEIMVETLPPNLKLQYQKTKPGTRSMYSEMNATIKTPVGVTCCAWEGLSNVLKKANAEYQFVNSNQTADMNGFFFIPFKDKTLAIRNTIQNQLLFNGFYRINTKAYNAGEFEVPIMNNSSVYIDIYNQYFFKQYSQLTTFIAYYNFFVDAITADVCAHFNVPNDIVGLLIYASNMLADNNYANELNSSLYRIRSTEVIPAIIHSQLAFAISRHKNRSGSKTRDNSLDFNPNCVIMDLEKLGTTETANALNPMVELHQKETITQKGFHGVNSDRAFNMEKRTYDSSMIGKIAMSSANNKNVGINRQLVADPKILSVRGYTSTDGVDADYNDLQLASFTELLTPGGVSRDDAIRTTIGTAQTGHIVSTAEAQPCLISNGVDEIVPSAVSEEFSVIADADGKVLEINEGYMIIQYKNGRKKAIPIKDRYSANPGGGFYVNNKLTPNVEPNQSFKQGTILAYHEKFFNKGIDGVVRMNLGPLAKVAFTGLYSTYEDAGLMTESFSKKLATFVTMKQHKTIDATDNIEFIVKVGDEVEIGDPLIIFGLGDTGDKSVDNFLKAFGNDTTNLLDSAKRVVKAKHAGRIADVKMYTIKSMDKLSPSLHKLFDQYFKENTRKRKILDKYDKSDSVYKLDTLYDLPTGPMKGSVIKGFVCDVLVEIYIEHEDFQSVGDKAVAYGPAKQVISEMIPLGMEPYSESHPDEEVSMFVTDSGVMKRMVPSIMLTAAGNKVLVELKRKVKNLWEGKQQ